MKVTTKFRCGVLTCETTHRTSTGAARCNVRADADLRTTDLIYVCTQYSDIDRRVGDAWEILRSAPVASRVLPAQAGVGLSGETTTVCHRAVQRRAVRGA